MGFNLIDDLVNILVMMSDISFSELNLFICMIFTFPIGYANRFLKDRTIRLVYGMLTGIMLQIQMYGADIYHVILATMNTYLFIKFMGRKVSSFYVLIFNIIHLSALHIKNMMKSYGDWSLGIEALYMMSICKFSSVAFNYEDGGKDEKEIQSSYHREKMLKEKPTLLETFAYIFYFPSSLIGPSFEFSDFIKFIRLEGEYKDINWSKANKATLKEVGQALFCLFLKVSLGKKFSTLHCGTEEFIQDNILYKYFFMVISMIVMRSTYYIGWKMSQASINFSGLSYMRTVKQGLVHESMDKIDSCNLKKIELDVNPRTRIQYWNRTVHLWLKYYIFLRLINIKNRPFRNNKALASLLTFMASAMWHGYYFVYYIFFFEYYMIEQVSTYLDEEKNLFNKIKTWRPLPMFLYRIFLMSVVNYFGLAFSILTLQGNLNYYKAFHYVPLAGLFGSWVWTKFAKKTKRVA